MWKRLRSTLFHSKPKELLISSFGQEECGLSIEQIQAVMEWLGMSLFSAGYRATAHMIWDSAAAPLESKTIFKGYLKRKQPTFLYRCGDRPMQPPTGCYWRLMTEHPSLRMYQLEHKDD